MNGPGPAQQEPFDTARFHLNNGETVALSCAQKVCLSGDYGDMHDGGVTLTAALQIRPQLHIRTRRPGEPVLLRDGEPFVDFQEWRLASCFRAEVAARNDAYQFTVFPSALIKVGLGSSGAAAVLFAAALALIDGSSPSARELIVSAHRFETDISGRECGPQDHAASVYGGLNVIEYPSLSAQRIPTGAIWPALSFWTANERRDAPEVIKEIAAAHTDEMWESKAVLTRRIAAACVAGDAGGFVDAIRIEARIQAELGMLTQQQRSAIAIVESIGGAAKVTGAGGGGVLVAAATDAAQERVVDTLSRQGLERLTLDPGERGLAIRTDSALR